MEVKDLGKFKDLTGMKFNQLTVLEFDHVEVNSKGTRTPMWKVQCDCGVITTKRGPDIKSGHTKSCGCLHKINTSKARKTHGETDTPLYYTWENMKKRCYKKNSERYKNYGARGIIICDEWHSFINFSDWAHINGYKEGLTIDRIDVNGNYEPSNCRWISQKEQAANRTTNVWVELDGEKRSPIDLAAEYKIPVQTIYMRISRGDTGCDIVRPIGKRRMWKR